MNVAGLLKRISFITTTPIALSLVLPAAYVQASTDVSVDIVFDSGLSFTEDDKIKIVYYDTEEETVKDITVGILEADEGKKITFDTDSTAYIQGLAYVGNNEALIGQDLAMPLTIYDSTTDIVVAIGKTAIAENFEDETQTFYANAESEDNTAYELESSTDKDKTSEPVDETKETQQTQASEEDSYETVDDMELDEEYQSVATAEETEEDEEDSINQKWKESKPLLQVLKKVIPLTVIFVIAMLWAYARKKKGKW